MYLTDIEIQKSMKEYNISLKLLDEVHVYVSICGERFASEAVEYFDRAYCGRWKSREDFVANYFDIPKFVKEVFALDYFSVPCIPTIVVFRRL